MNHPIARGLMFYFPLNEGTGSFHDASSNQKSTSILGATQINSGFEGYSYPAGAFPSGTGWKPSGGVNDVVMGLTDSSYCDNLPNLTVHCWALGCTGGNSLLVGKYAAGGNNTGQGWGLASDTTSGNKFYIGTQIGTSGTVYNEWDTLQAYTASSPWHNVVGTISNYAAQAIYVDGVAAALTGHNNGNVTTTTNTNPVTFGADLSSTNHTQDLFGGALDLMAVWNRVLAPEEIQKLYADPFCMFETPYVMTSRRGLVGYKSTPTQTITPLGIPSQEEFGNQEVTDPLGFRESIIQALLDLALTATSFNSSGRRLQLWSKVASFPALFIQSTGTHYPPREARMLPPKRTITAELWVYTDVGKDPNANPEEALNDIIDAIEAALAPGINSNVQTLGGLVYHAWIEGNIEQFPGVLDGIAKAIIPVKILIP
ncbi:MAG: hypothetical protein KGI29_05320 [Pseudomonadota bacterium]|nr:hypothetical protein [Pseudomonadota bacterium]